MRKDPGSKVDKLRPTEAIHLFWRELDLDWWGKQSPKCKLEIKFD